jgi:hypothetical protein
VEAVVILVAVAVIAGIAISVVRREFERVTIFEFQRGLRYDKGRFGGVVGPGQYRLLRRRSTITKVDSRPRVVTVPGQEVITAARVMQGNPALMHLRMLQELGRSGGNTIVVGLPGSTTPLPLRESAERGGEEPLELPPRDE